MLFSPAQLTAQCIEMHIYRACIVFETSTPNIIEQFLSRTNAVGMGRKVVQQTVLQACQVDFVPVLAHTTLHAVYLDIVCNCTIHNEFAVLK